MKLSYTRLFFKKKIITVFCFWQTMKLIILGFSWHSNNSKKFFSASSFFQTQLLYIVAFPKLHQLFLTLRVPLKTATSDTIDVSVCHLKWMSFYNSKNILSLKIHHHVFKNMTSTATSIHVCINPAILKYVLSCCSHT